MMPEPSENGDECTSIAAGGVCKEMGEVWGEIDEHKDTTDSERDKKVPDRGAPTHPMLPNPIGNGC